MLCFPTADYEYTNIDVQLPLNSSIQLCCFVVNEKNLTRYRQKFDKIPNTTRRTEVKNPIFIFLYKTKKIFVVHYFLWGTRYIPSNIMKDKYNRRYIAK